MLSHLPQPGTPFALGLDEAVYLSVHSAVARLVAPGHHLVSVAAYLPAEDDPGQTLTRMERLADLAQPGWRDHLVHRRHLPNLVVSNANVTAAAGGFAGRPPAAVPGADGLFVAGDWVGPEGMLYDAAAASGKRAGQLAAAHARQHAPASMALA